MEDPRLAVRTVEDPFPAAQLPGVVPDDRRRVARRRCQRVRDRQGVARRVGAARCTPRAWNDVPKFAIVQRQRHDQSLNLDRHLFTDPRPRADTTSGTSCTAPRGGRGGAGAPSPPRRRRRGLRRAARPRDALQVRPPAPRPQLSDRL